MSNETKIKLLSLVLITVLTACEAQTIPSFDLNAASSKPSSSDTAASAVSVSSDSPKASLVSEVPIVQESTPDVTASPSPSPSPSTSPSPSSIPVSLTVYQKSFTEAPLSGYVAKKYTATAYCTDVASSTYCWDNGIQTIAAFNDNNVMVGPFTYSYWQLYTELGSLTVYCHGGCPNDAASSPMIVSHNFVLWETQAKINAVFASGISNVVSCTKLNGVITCPTFVIDTN